MATEPTSTGITSLVARTWRALEAWWAALQPIWFAVVVSAAVSVGVQNPQFIDALASTAADKGAWSSQHLALAGGLLLFALSAWYFPRAILYVRYSITPRVPDERYEPWRRLVPRVLGLLPIASVGVAFVRNNALSGGQRLLYGSSTAAIGVVFVMVVVLRRQLALREAVGLHEELPQDTYRALLGLLVLQLALFALFVASKTRVPQAIGPVGLILVAAAAVLGMTTTVLIYPTYRFRLPSLCLAGFLAAALFSVTNDNHQIRTVVAGPSAASRPRASEHLGRWLESRRSSWATASAAQPYPIFIVAAEGGGIRAAYWTAATLTTLQARHPDFACHLFAVSGVSGGSLGGAVFAGEVADLVDRSSWRCDSVSPSDAVKPTAPYRGMLGEDFLSPTLAGLLFPDLLQRFLPRRVLPDRAAYLETAWEAAWQAHTSSDRFAGPFLDLWGTPERALNVPSLFLNGTWVESGERVIVSNLALDEFGFSRLDDLLSRFDAPLALSTAVHLSARFTYVSPAATITTSSAARMGRIVDGGYFENSGALTAHELVDLVHGVCAGIPDCESRVVPVAIVISNNIDNPNRAWANTPDDCSALLADQPTSPPRSGGWLTDAMGELTSPIWALFNTRSARGFEAEEHLREVATPCRTIRFQLERDTKIRIPLGWMLSGGSADAITAQAEGHPSLAVVGRLLRKP